MFRGGWAADAADAVSADSELPAEDILDLTGSLVERSLVVADHHAGRFRMLETIRQYAAERLVEAGESDALHTAHARFYEHLAHQAEPHLRTERQTEWLQRLRAEQDNLRAALAWCRDHPQQALELGLRLAAALGWFWYLGDHVDGRHQLRETLRLVDDAHDVAPEVHARVLQAVAMVGRPGACVVHPDARCAEAARASVALFDAAGDAVGAALSRLLTAVEGAGGADVASSLAAIAEAEPTLAAADHRWGFALADFVRMEVLMSTADGEQAIRAGRRAVARFHDVGDRWGVSAVLSHLGPNLRRLGRLTEAVEILRESQRIAREVSLWNTVQWVSADLGLTQLMLGRDDEAGASFDEAERIATGYGLPAGQGLAHLGRGHLARRAGDPAAAREHFRLAVSLCEQVGSPVLTGTALSGLGYAEESAGELDRAERTHRRVLELAQATQALPLMAAGLEGLAGVAAARGDAEGAGELLGRASALRDRSGHAPHPLERSDVERISHAARAGLGTVGFDAAVSRGRRHAGVDELPAP